MQIVSSGATHNEGESGLAYDRTPGTRWTTGTAQEPGMAFWVELDAPAMIAGIHATAPTPDDDPKAWVVAVMDSAGGHGRKEVATGTGPVIAQWEPVRGQVVRIEQMGSDAFYWWSMSDLTIFGEDIAPEPPPPGPEPPPPDPDPEPPPDGEPRPPWPETFTEEEARFWVEHWGRKFGWEVREQEQIDFMTGAAKMDRVIRFPLWRTKVDDRHTVERWPFTE